MTNKILSVLCQFTIRRNYTKTFESLKTRILTKITRLTTIQFLNKFVFKDQMCKPRG